MTTTPDDPEYRRFLDIAAFLYARGLGAPAVLAHDPATRQVLLEDLGTDTLETLMHAEPDRAADLYGRALDRLADLQVFGAEARALCPAAWDRPFDREHLRWETDYFREQFLIGHVGFAPGDLTGLDAEFEQLAAVALRQPRTLVHRDFQSQNILLKDGMVRLVDVQGMRWGPAAYDAASLLLDPYVDLPAPLRDDLAASFPGRVAARGGPRLAAADWNDMVRTAALQRLMQALGAYCFLGHVRQRPGFLQHIPTALRRLSNLVPATAKPANTDFAPPPLPLLARHLQRSVGLLDRR